MNCGVHFPLYFLLGASYRYKLMTLLFSKLKWNERRKRKGGEMKTKLYQCVTTSKSFHIYIYMCVCVYNNIHTHTHMQWNFMYITYEETNITQELNFVPKTLINICVTMMDLEKAIDHQAISSHHVNNDLNSARYINKGGWKASCLILS